MIRKIVKIDEEKCDGCGLCVDACHEGALRLVDGKARLVSDSYCDGLGDCLPECPVGAITLEEREAAPFDEEAVKELQARRMEARQETDGGPHCMEEGEEDEFLPCGCVGTKARVLKKEDLPQQNVADSHQAVEKRMGSQLRQWPCQIKLVPVNAPFLSNAHLLIAADCTAFAYANLHADFMRNRITLVGCPKLDGIDYAEKLTAILKTHEIKSITVLKMEVPCCEGLLRFVKKAMLDSGVMIPWQVVTISTGGEIVE
ncbi:MAG: 4Fe-4S binding protein [Firmicutes bacterium]|jgi:ferredoxin|nr:4Fe-4S binding protein [Bacillota bacterium]